MNSINRRTPNNTPSGTDTLAKLGLNLQISNLQPTSRSLENTDGHYGWLYDSLPVACLTVNAEGIIIESNVASADMLGIERNKLIKQRFTRFVAEDFRDQWERHDLLSQQTPGNQYCELALLRADGSPVYVRLDSIYKQASADTLPVLLITLTDITEYKQTGDELSIAAVAFETQEGIIVTDANKKILRVNHAFTRITGYSAEEALDNTPAILCSGQHDENFHQSIWVSVLSSGYWQGEIWEKRKNGEVFPVWLTLTAVLGKDSCINHYVCSITDITAQKQAEKILLDARHRLENQVTSTKEELEKVKKETAEINSALTVLLKHRETDKSQHQLALSREVEETILPFLKKLKKASENRIQSSQLISILEINLIQLISAYGRKDSIPAAFQQLSPVEAQVASMVRQGLPTKVIASTLRISEGTVSIHRNHIRKKLGLNKKTNNLQTYLKSLLD